MWAALRMRHCPTRYSFHTRYVYDDLPTGVTQRLEPLFLVTGPAELRERRQQASAWFAEVLAELTPEASAEAVGVTGSAASA